MDAFRDLINRLVECAEGGEESAAAFAEIVERYSEPVYLKARRIAGNVHAADALVSDIWFDFLQQKPTKLAKLSTEKELLTFLSTIARRRFTDSLRTRSRATEVRTSGSLGAVAEEALLRPGADADELQRLQAGLVSLEPRQQACVLLHYWHQMPLRDIAKAIGATEPAVKMILHRTRMSLMTSIKDRRHEE